MTISFVNTYDAISTQAIASLLNLLTDIIAKQSAQHPWLPIKSTERIDQVIAANYQENQACVFQYFTALQLQHKMCTEKPAAKFNIITITMPAKLRIQCLLHDWLGRGMPAATVLAQLNQALIDPSNAQALKLYDFYFYFQTIYKQLMQDIKKLQTSYETNPEQCDIALLSYIISPECQLFCIALSLNLAFDVLDSQCAGMHIDFLSLFTQADTFNQFYQCITASDKVLQLDLDAPELQSIFNHLKSLVSIDWNTWQKDIFNQMQQPEFKKKLQCYNIHSVYFNLLGELDYFKQNHFIASTNYFLNCQQNQYYEFVHVPLLESMLKQDLISAEQVTAVQQHNAKLIYDLSGEALTFDHETQLNWLQFHENIANKGIPSDRVFFICSNAKAKDHYHEWAEQNNVKNRIHVLGNNFWLALRAHEMMQCPEFQREKDNIIKVAYRTIENNQLRAKHYLCLNFKARNHRIALLLFMYHRGYLALGNVSYLGKIHNRAESDVIHSSEKYIAPPGIHDFLMQIEHGEKYLADYDAFERLRPIVYDIGNQDTINERWPFKQYFPEIKHYAALTQLDTYFEIVTETYFMDPKTLFISEKTIRPILRMQIFIIVGSVHSLQLLQSMGFQTFAPYIDESYDAIVDPAQRMQAIFHEIDRLCQLPLAELDELYRQLWPRILHNFNHFAHNLGNFYQSEAKAFLETFS